MIKRRRLIFTYSDGWKGVEKLSKEFLKLSEYENSSDQAQRLHGFHVPISVKVLAKKHHAYYYAYQIN